MRHKLHKPFSQTRPVDHPKLGSQFNGSQLTGCVVPHTPLDMDMEPASKVSSILFYAF